MQSLCTYLYEGKSNVEVLVLVVGLYFDLFIQKMNKLVLYIRLESKLVFNNRTG